MNTITIAIPNAISCFFVNGFIFCMNSLIHTRKTMQKNIIAWMTCAYISLHMASWRTF